MCLALGHLTCPTAYRINHKKKFSILVLDDVVFLIHGAVYCKLTTS